MARAVPRLNRRYRRKLGVLSLIVVVLVAVVGVLVERALLLQEQRTQIATVQVDLDLIRTQIEDRAFQNLLILNGLAVYAAVTPEMTDEQFERYAAEVFRMPHQLRNLALSRGFVIEYVYPLEGNRQVLGVNYRDVPAQMDSLQRAIASEGMVIDGPVELIQGGVGLIGRVPVFARSEMGLQFIGIASGVLDREALLDPAIETASRVGLDFAIGTHGPDGASGGERAIFGDLRELRARNAIETEIVLGVERWNVLAVPAEGWVSASSYRMGVFAIAVLVVLGIMAPLAARLRQSQRLADVEAERAHYIELIDRYVITSQTDTAGRITQASDAFCRISGYHREELLGNTHRIVRHPENPPALFDEMWRTIASGHHWHGELRNRTKSGETYWVEADIDPQFDENGAITGYLSVRRDVTARKLVEELSRVDSLTGIANRLELDTILRDEHMRFQRYRTPYCVIVLDVDHFKRVNDEYGHLEGDRVLAELGRQLASRLRKADRPGRWGGEEFLIICPESDRDGATQLAETLRATVAEHDYGLGRPLTVSMGVAEAAPGDDVETVVGRADEALYAAKRGGRNRVMQG